MMQQKHAKPPWLRVKIPSGEEYKKLSTVLKKYNLNTVCREARCPNIAECWRSGHATIMIFGDTCTRSCKFCAVAHSSRGKPLNPDEPLLVAGLVKKCGLKYLVLTSVTRDDLADGGAFHYAEVIEKIKDLNTEIRVEALIPDYTGENLKTVVSAKPDVLAHNIETVKRLVPLIRDNMADYEKSLMVLEQAKSLDSSVLTKSSLLLGLGESEDEVIKSLEDLRSVHTDIVALGQYLQPTKIHAKVMRYVHPAEFESYRRKGLEMGFRHVFSAPLVRSSYRASEVFR
jgi:lipoic acid synthetase